MWRFRLTAGLAAVLFVLVMLARVSAEPQGEKAPELKADDLVIEGVTVINVERGVAVPGQWVVVSGERITGVFDGAPAMKAAKRTIDGRGQFLIPGLIDSHVHYVDRETYGRLFIASGVTLVRDMASDTDQVIALREQLRSGEMLGPRMICTGAIIDGKPPIWPFSYPCETPEEAREAVRALKKAGVDMVKVYSKLQPEVYRAACEEAKAQGLHAVGHVPESVTLADALAAGQYTNEHLMGFPGLIASMLPEAERPAERGLFKTSAVWAKYSMIDLAKLRAQLETLRPMAQCPTIVVMQGIGSIATGEGPKDPRTEFVSAAMTAFWSGEQYHAWSASMPKQLPGIFGMTKALYDAGVPLLVGTDLANPYVFAGSSLHDEMKNFAKAGIPNAETLRSATITPAKWFGLDKDYGTIATGKVASMVLLSANPLDDIANTTKINGVMLAGQYFDRAALDGLLADAKAAAKGTAKPVETDAPKQALVLPGEVIAKGVYRSTFKQGKQTMDAGTEEFLVTRDAAGTHIQAITSPVGGWSKPTFVEMHADADGRVVKARYSERVKDGLSAMYVLDGDTWTAKAMKAGKDLEPQTMKVPERLMFSASTNSSLVISMAAMNLQPGETREVNSMGFGFPDWKLAVQPMSVQRKPDEKVTIGAVEHTARVYVATAKGPMGQITQTMWLNDRSVPLKVTIAMAFGTVTTEMQP